MLWLKGLGVVIDVMRFIFIGVSGSGGYVIFENEQFGLTFDLRGNVKGEKQYQTYKSNIFAAGDARRGQSLIVWAISEGREVAHQIDTYLMGSSDLPQKNMAEDLMTV